MLVAAGGMSGASPPPPNMPTIQCPRCRHTFLSYAPACPECGLSRPRDLRSLWGPCLALMVSGLALAFTVWVAWRFDHPDPVLPAPQMAGKADARTAVTASAAKVAQAAAKQP